MTSESGLIDCYSGDAFFVHEAVTYFFSNHFQTESGLLANGSRLMVTIKGGGTTYQIGSGKEMPWEDVPQSFKKTLSEQHEIEECVDMKQIAQKCISDHGFWDKRCVELTEKFHLCQGNALRSQLPQRRD